MACAHTIVHDPFGCDQKQFYKHIWSINYTAFIVGTTAEKGNSEVFVSLQPRARGGLLSCYS